MADFTPKHGAIEAEEAREYMRLRRLAFPDHMREMSNTWWQNNLDKRQAYHAKYLSVEKNMVRYRNRIKLWQLQNPEKVAEYRAREIAKRNPERERARKKAYYLANKDNIRIQNRFYYRRRRLSDPWFRMRQSLQSRMAMAVKRQGSIKSAKTMQLIGCTVQFLRQHLENQFLAQMSWITWFHVRDLI